MGGMFDDDDDVAAPLGPGEPLTLKDWFSSSLSYNLQALPLLSS